MPCPRPLRACQVGDIGAKVFEATADAQREARRVVLFHRTLLPRLPGLPNERVQRSLDVGFRRDRQSEERAFVIRVTPLCEACATT